MKPLLRIITITAFLAGGGVASFGFIQMFLLGSYHASWSNLTLTLTAIFATILSIYLISRLLKINYYAVFAIIVVSSGIVIGNIWPLLVALWILTAGYALGSKFVFFLKINSCYLDDLSILLIGLGIYATIIGLLAHFSINYPGLYLFMLIIPTITGRHLIIEKAKIFRKLINEPSQSEALDIIIVVCLLIHFYISLMPEIGHDALMMHLFVPG